ncbi:hypothetical protein COTS27_00656 [Spirochaetota bacterium]|nr:hypothetical protein COTS27_00656 [Spirochaetota bacterium]
MKSELNIGHNIGRNLLLLGRGCFLLVLLSQCVAWTSLFAVEIRLNSPHKVYSDGEFVYVDAEGSQTIISEKTLVNLKYNIPITITYYLELHERLKFNFSRKRANIQIINRITHDIWSGSYIVEKANKKERYLTKEALEVAILNLNKVPIIRAEAINPNRTYFIKSRVVLKIRNYSSYYELINGLLSIFKYRTSYYHSQNYNGAEMLRPLAEINL